jgi:polysaccharide export outer membrane protein
MSKLHKPKNKGESMLQTKTILLGNRMIYVQITALLSVMLLLTACGSHKNIAYFKDIKDSVYNTPVASVPTSFSDPRIQPNDILQVTIQTIDPQANNVLSGSNNAYAAPAAAGTQAPQQAQVPGFLVDKNGMIQLPLVGSIKAGGLTTSEMRDLVTEKVARYYKDPVVNVRLANFTVTVLGEVTKPSAYLITNEKASILDALGMAGDITIYGKRENVMLIREEAGEKKFVRFNLNSSDIIRSPYYYLRQGDVIYVEPGKAKAATTDMAKTRNYALLASGLSVLIVLLSRINF